VLREPDLLRCGGVVRQWAMDCSAAFRIGTEHPNLAGITKLVKDECGVSRSDRHNVCSLTAADIEVAGGRWVVSVGYVAFEVALSSLRHAPTMFVSVVWRMSE